MSNVLTEAGGGLDFRMQKIARPKSRPERAGSSDRHMPFHTTKGYTLSLTKQVFEGRLDTVIKTIEHVRLV